ncbi:MAG: PAS domain S-box protein, partial [Deltaproteobacteria bacterium]|nr:PAS domain S-box protein [Deltaproteobacteria bacterium]
LYKRYIWGGIILVLFQAIMIIHLLINRTRRHRAEESIKQHLQLQTLLTRVSARFTILSLDNIDSAIEEGLAQIGKHLDIARIALLQFSADETELHLTHGYALHTEDSPPKFIVSEQLPWFSGSLSQGKILRISKAEDIPKEAVAEREYMKRQGFKSLLTIPMIISESVIGAISYSDVKQEREWSDQLISQLVILTEMFANALKRKQTEKELHESEKRYRALVDESPSSILVFQDGHCIFSNQAGLRLLGFSYLKDIVGRPALDFVPPEFHNLAIQRMEGLAQEKSNPTIEFELLKTDGTTVAVETTSVPIQIGGKPAGLVICNDITKRKHAEMELLKSREDFRNLAGKLLSVQESERRRLAREMHDDLTQRLAVLAIDIGKIERDFQDTADPVFETLRSVRERLVNLSGDIHAISRQLHPSILEDLGLADAVKSECSSFTGREGIAVDYRTESVPPGIPADVAICIYRIVQEGLRNVAKHADTTQLQVSLTGKDDAIHLTIKDQGAGFDPKKTEKKLGLGLVSMQERVRLIQGDISIESRPGKGTIINVRAPLKDS